MTTKDVKDYLNQQFPPTIGHIPIQEMLDKLALHYLQEGARRAERKIGTIGIQSTKETWAISKAILTTAEQWTEKDL